ncbi:hypothetical protein [Nocardia pneumoniae]|uniref:hypothetical protein n=1 Tax=Nocardia pneumoniae TaxID=228601 RepID=UPI000315032A|nr:hypothetical protein [Nocardia pneumoniae]
MGDRLTRPRSGEPDWTTAREIADQIAAEAGVSEEDLAWADEVLGLDDSAVPRDRNGVTPTLPTPHSPS